MTYLTVSRQRLSPSFFALSLAVVTFSSGCGQNDEIRSYTVAKEQSASATASPTASDRMLAAIVPSGSQAWFFKVVGPQPVVDKTADEINKFFATIRAPEGERARWELPEGWREEAGSQMRAATLWIPADGKPLEMSVSSLPWSGTNDDVLRNVNRWRTQMNLPAVGPAELSDSTREIEAGDATITVAELTGQFQGGPAMGPFAGGGMPGGTPPSAGDTTAGAGSELPAGHPPIDALVGGTTGDASGSSAQPGPLAADAPKFHAPASWQSLPVQPGGMRRAAFGVVDGEQQALVTVIAFASTEGQMIGDPLMNVNRWRREVGLSEIEQDELESIVETIEVDGDPGRYVKLIPDIEAPEQSQAKLGTLAAMVTSGDRIWFIKMIGSRELVADQEDEFKAFLKSIRFAGES